MLKIEKRLVEFLDKHMLLLAAILVTGLAFWLRKQCIWFYGRDYAAYFDAHTGNIQSSLYYLVLHWLGYLPLPPIQSVKWMAIAADFVVAVQCVLLFGGGKKGLKCIEGSERTRLWILYTACLFSPVFFLRGAVWSLTDSVAMVFLLAAFGLDRKKHSCLALLAAVLGAAWYPCFIILVIGYLYLYKKEGSRQQMGLLLLFCGLTGGLLALCGVVNGVGAADGFYSALRWMSFDPVTGMWYPDAAQWLLGMVICFGYGIGFLCGICAYLRRIPASVGLLVNVSVAILFGSYIF